MTETNKIEFRGAGAVKLTSCILKNLLVFYGMRIINVKLYEKYNQDNIDDFIKENLKKKSFLNDFINLTDFNEDEVNLIMSFTKDSNGIPYTPAMVSVMEVKKIKEALKAVLSALFNLDFYFLNEDAPSHSVDLGEKWKEAAKSGNANIELKDIVNL
jgi:hypothetical protein